MPTANDSSTGGFLAPSGIGGELNDAALQDFLQQIVAGTTGIDGTLVRPRWQSTTPDLPDANTSWAAIGVTRRTRDKNTFNRHTADPGDIVYRNQILEVACSFYGPAAEANSERLAMGLFVAQNRETLALAGYGLIEVNDPITAPELINTQWLYRVDLNFRVRRAQLYTYAVLDLAGAQVSTQITDSDIELVVNLPLPPAPGSDTGYGEDDYGGGGYGTGQPAQAGYGTGGSGGNPYGG